MFHFTLDSDLKKEHLSPFEELILSWNADRPFSGSFLFLIRLKIEEWSSWLPYAFWGKEGQGSFSYCTSSIRINQDCIEILEGKKATGFEIRIVSQEGAIKGSFFTLHGYIKQEAKEIKDEMKEAVFLEVEGLSQMALNHPRHKDLCSPVSMTAVLRFLLKKEICPLQFAKDVYDLNQNIFGNWVLNVAQASTFLGPLWQCWVERLNGFEEVYLSLQKKVPVIVSVRGPLEGGALPYQNGHLLVVSGYDPLAQKVHCMDPAFPSDCKTKVSYFLPHFLRAWNRRGRVAYRLMPVKSQN